MSDEPMSLDEAFQVAEQLSPLPAVAHRALQTMAQEARRWRFWIDAMLEPDGRMRGLLTTFPGPRTTEEFDRVTDQAIVLAAWKACASDAGPRLDATAEVPHG